MQIQNENTTDPCSRLHRYLGGELSEDDEVAFESHAAFCADCGIEVQLHRNLSIGIEQFADEQIKLPDDFSKVVAVNAESQVSGLRKSNERRVTFTILAVLAALIFIVLGANLTGVARIAGFI